MLEGIVTCVETCFEASRSSSVASLAETGFFCLQRGDSLEHARSYQVGAVLDRRSLMEFLQWS